MQPVVQFENITKAYGPAVAVDNLNLTIEPGKFVTLLGPSGCGKSTTLRMLGGFETPNAGRILLAGKDVTHLPPNKRNVNIVFQDYALFPHMDVARNIAFGLELQGKPSDVIHRRVMELLALVRLEAFAGRLPSELSGGQRQRVALMRALAPDPQVLLLDEPLSALDRNLRQAMQIELKNLQHEVGISFLVVTHDQEEALVMSDRIAVMDGGRIQQVGTPGEIYDAPANRFVAGFIGVSNVYAGIVSRRDGLDSVIRTDGGMELRARHAAFAPGSRVDCMLRPEQLRIGARGDDSASVLEAVVERLVFIGADQQVHARLTDGSQVKALMRHRRADAWKPEPGASIRLHYEPATVHLMAADPAT